MDVSYLKGKVPGEIVESLEKRGIHSLTPPQEQAVLNGLLDGKNIVVASPTASGKTLVAEIAAINTVLTHGMKAVYIGPMRALVSEKFEEFKKNYPYLKSAISIGDLDSNDPWLSDFELIFMSTEKFDSLIRHGVDWLGSVGCIVFDELHTIGDQSRGPTLELLITKLKDTTKAQIVALSATIGNAEELAKWLSARLVKSDYRPVPLRKGVVNGDYINYIDKSAKEKLGMDSAPPELRVIDDTLGRGKQALVFYSTKRNAEAGAARISEYVNGELSDAEKEKLNEVAENVLNVLQRPTEQCKKLSGLVRKGVAFHHSGLMNQQRWYIEDAFKRGLIKVICSTTTLALGVNTPAHTVLVKDTSRYSNGLGSERLGVNEVLQLFGRAGRPGYDTEGRALLIAKNSENAKELVRRYLEAEPEPIDSGLGMAPAMRMHVLAFIAEDFLNSTSALEEFMLHTFYGYQYGRSRHIREVVREVLESLEQWGFIIREGKERYTATRIGKRVSELYIDPLSARWIIEALSMKQDLIGVLYMISNTLEMRPYLRATEEAESMYVHYRHLNKSIWQDYEKDESLGYYDPVGAFSTALMLYDWINEAREDVLINKYATTPGAIYSKLAIADWIAYSATELAKLVKANAREITDIRIRIKYGIKEELLDLVRLEQIGRVRARMLYSNGITSVAEVKANRAKVEKILGKEVTQRVFEQFV